MPNPRATLRGDLGGTLTNSLMPNWSIDLVSLKDQRDKETMDQTQRPWIKRPKDQREKETVDHVSRSLCLFVSVVFLPIVSCTWSLDFLRLV